MCAPSESVCVCVCFIKRVFFHSVCCCCFSQGFHMFFDTYWFDFTDFRIKHTDFQLMVLNSRYSGNTLSQCKYPTSFYFFQDFIDLFIWCACLFRFLPPHHFRARTHGNSLHQIRNIINQIGKVDCL